MAATQALREVVTAGVAPESIASITVHVPPPTLKMIDHGVEPGDRASHLTSVQYHLALAACDPEALLDVGHSPAALSADVQDFMGRTSVVAGADRRAYITGCRGENRRPRARRSAAAVRRARRLRQVSPRHMSAGRQPHGTSSGAVPRGFRGTVLACRFDCRDYAVRRKSRSLRACETLRDLS
jgi:hypothetical protein